MSQLTNIKQLSLVPLPKEVWQDHIKVEAAEAKDDLKNTATSVEPALSEEEINNLRLCRCAKKGHLYQRS